MTIKLILLLILMIVCSIVLGWQLRASFSRKFLGSIFIAYEEPDNEAVPNPLIWLQIADIDDLLNAKGSGTFEIKVQGNSQKIQRL